jgi:hypothetical protein
LCRQSQPDDEQRYEVADIGPDGRAGNPEPASYAAASSRATRAQITLRTSGLERDAHQMVVLARPPW